FVTKELKYLLESGFEVGLHGNYNAATDAASASNELKRLAAALNTGVNGYRNHYLCFDIEKSWAIWEQLGIKHDSTFGYANMPGFRNGMCYPFHPYSCAEKRYYDIVELPLIAMDATLFNYLKLDVEGAFALVQQLFERVKACNGVFTLLWHNNYTTGAYGKLYARLLGYFESQNAWMPTHNALVEWWKENDWLEKTTAMLNELNSQPAHEAPSHNG
ncbi:MAG TPA: polysaccharide deacetylase family protein, partial [Chitinophagales bacterium]|nr:polysaccharide deacetylase family protein [Chitinophagales bacterium]